MNVAVITVYYFFIKNGPHNWLSTSDIFKFNIFNHLIFFLQLFLLASTSASRSSWFLSRRFRKFFNLFEFNFPVWTSKSTFANVYPELTRRKRIFNVFSDLFKYFYPILNYPRWKFFKGKLHMSNYSNNIKIVTIRIVQLQK